MNQQLQTVLDALEAANGCLDAGTLHTMRRVEEAIEIIKSMMQAEPVAWANDSAMQGRVGSVCSTSAKRYWEKSDWVDKQRAELHRHPLYAAPQAVPAERIKRETIEECVRVCHTVTELAWDHSSPPGQYETVSSQAMECARKIKELLP